MASITAGGIGSGLDVESIVSQLVALERRPINRVQAEQAQVNAQISAYGSLKSKVSEFQSAMASLGSASSFKLFQGTSSNESVFTATVGSEALAGNYAVDVQSLAERDKIAFGPFADSATAVGSGTLNLSVGTESFSLAVGAGDTLADIRTAINESSDNTGVTATIVNSDDGARLVLSSNETGTDNALQVTVSGDGDGNDSDNAGLSALTYVSGGTNYATTISTATDAVMKIDGFTVTSSSNTISDAVDGISFTAKSIGTATLEVTRDDEAILEAVNQFAEAYNSLRSEVNKQRNGQLEADSTLLSIERALSEVLNAGSEINGSSFRYLIEAGVSVNEEGVMEIDEATVTEKLSSDFNSFVNLFSAEGEGYAERLESLADGWLANNGLIDAREEGLSSQLERLEDDELRLEARLEMVEMRIRSQFTALDTLVSELSNTGNFLQQQLAALPAANQ
ncbi:flagellar filament capping protein FliD [Methylophaga sp.]|jgi:flagellar hook-associated protein 2|uniref:flagellar filament capping protein FliD n=1 Tax=Methylophaga sp. TaxID=2024840 RepID=UPI0014018481|nr:flagellar filament capping protein FliD [Methylophaga sp.]MTI63763.1 flagellar cap protein [Methylophaga sp.]